MKISNGHISATPYPLHYMYVHRQYTLPSDAVKTLDACEIRHLFSKGGNESTCVIKRKNETADLEK